MQIKERMKNKKEVRKLRREKKKKERHGKRIKRNEIARGEMGNE